MALGILIVDADQTAAHVTEALARRIMPNATVHSALTLESGWTALQQDKPDLLIIDPSAFGPAGPVLIRLCNELHPATRVVVLTAPPSTTLRRALHELRVDRTLEKPAAPAVLIEALNAEAQRAQQLRHAA